MAGHARERDVIPFTPLHWPRLWFVRLMNAIQDGDPALERMAMRELNAMGITVEVSPEWRKGAVITDDAL